MIDHDQIRKDRTFQLMDMIENRTGKMLHELDNARFKSLIDIMPKYPRSALSAFRNWYEEVNK